MVPSPGCCSSPHSVCYTDFVIVGSGIAGLYTAINSPSPRCCFKQARSDCREYLVCPGGLQRRWRMTMHRSCIIRIPESRAEFGDPEAITVLVNEAHCELMICRNQVFYSIVSRESLIWGGRGSFKNRVVHIGDATGRRLKKNCWPRPVV